MPVCRRWTSRLASKPIAYCTTQTYTQLPLLWVYKGCVTRSEVASWHAYVLAADSVQLINDQLKGGVH